MKAIVWILVALMFVIVWTRAEAHDVYSGMRTKHGQPCCGGDDCRPYPASKVFVMREGYMLADGAFVRFDEAIASPTEDYIRCDWNGQKARCFAVPGAS